MLRSMVLGRDAFKGDKGKENGLRMRSEGVVCV